MDTWVSSAVVILSHLEKEVKVLMQVLVTVTQKVHEYESFSESDTENADSKRSKGPPKPTENVDKDSPPTTSKNKSTKGKAPASKKASPVTNKSPLKSKQQSLMSFFKKKD